MKNCENTVTSVGSSQQAGLYAAHSILRNIDWCCFNKVRRRDEMVEHTASTCLTVRWNCNSVRFFHFILSITVLSGCFLYRKIEQFCFVWSWLILSSSHRFFFFFSDVWKINCFTAKLNETIQQNNPPIKSKTTELCSPQGVQHHFKESLTFLFLCSPPLVYVS